MYRLKCIIAACFLILTSKTYCQETNPFEFIQPEILKYVGSEKIVYTDRITEVYLVVKETYNEKLYQRTGSNKKIAFQFTKSEKHYILQQLKLCTKPIWSDALFNDSKMISADSVIQYYKIKQKLNIKLYRLIDTPEYSREFRLASIKEISRKNWIFMFSNPIYIRNNSLAVIFIKRLCGLDCGNGELAVYRKTNGKWEKWIYICRFVA
ncbi:MAG: hypothetical protein H0X33_01780 [Taibaiella sp.]|nr:hypothetical protein [Taibaiella sp.]